MDRKKNNNFQPSLVETDSYHQLYSLSSTSPPTVCCSHGQASCSWSRAGPCALATARVKMVYCWKGKYFSIEKCVKLGHHLSDNSSLQSWCILYPCAWLRTVIFPQADGEAVVEAPAVEACDASSHFVLMNNIRPTSWDHWLVNSWDSYIIVYIVFQRYKLYKYLKLYEMLVIIPWCT